MTKSILWKEVRIPIKGNIVRGSYSVTRQGLVTVKIGPGIKAAHRAGLSAATVARILLRELAAEEKSIDQKKAAPCASQGPNA
jgi:hypothetical protein